MMLFEVDSDHSKIQTYLQSCGMLGVDARVEDVSMAGEGNMNVVLRIKHSEGSIILKQARPYVQKYPILSAPIERIEVEARYYQAICQHPGLSSYMPRVLQEDEKNYLLLLEDLGDLDDMTVIYQANQELTLSSVEALVDYLLILHHDLPPEVVGGFPDNLKLRKLNYEHLFVYPYTEANGLDLDYITPGLQNVANLICQDDRIAQQVQRLGAIYLSSGPSLLHGDFYPGSWFELDHKVMVLDPEFAFAGPPEFDLGVMLGHFHLAGVSADMMDLATSRYQKKHKLDQELIDQFTGAEIIRRLIGLAQLPQELDLNQKSSLIDKARNLMTSS